MLRGEAALAPRDSQKQIDADFYGGMWDSVAGAAQGAWTLVSDPALAAAGIAAAAAHPVDTAKDAIAYDDWTEGREPRALGRNAADLFLGGATLGAGKIASTLGRETRVVGEPRGNVDGAPAAPASVLLPAALPRADAVRNVVLGKDGTPHGREDSKGVYLVDASTLQTVRSDLEQALGPPSQIMNTGKGTVEVWMMDDGTRANVTYRSYSSSGGATIDVNRIDGINVARYHIENGGGP